MDFNVEKMFEIYDESKNKILLYVESSVSPHQFRALRKLILDELGKSGAEGKVRQLLERHGPAGTETRKGGGV
ncbi:MAG: hypothetical protein KBD53_09370 [Candidatus Omnitrophica bacterium]|nr:hypothetical protein [Candidatus Omnitrophota bacterium]